MEEREPLWTAGRTIKGAAAMESSKEVPQKWKTELLYDLAIPFLGYLSEGNENTNLKRYLYIHIQCNIIYTS